MLYTARFSFISFVFCLLLSAPTFAQFNFVYNNTIPVIKGSDTLSLAWAGGLNHPQFSTIDLDFDGKDELVAYEPETQTIKVFKSEVVNGKVVYHYWHNGRYLFPSALTHKVKLVDYNGDGKKDLFTYSNGGLKVYENVSTPVEGIQWKKVADPLMVQTNTGDEKLYSAPNDISAYVDIDGDGDIDILSFAPDFKRVIWYKNVSIEDYGNVDTLLFVEEHPCWGDFSESTTGDSIVLNSTNSPCGQANPIVQLPVNFYHAARHQGPGSLLALDLNNDGLMDLIIGDGQYNSVTAVVNSGTTNSAIMDSVDNQFPSYNVPINLPNYVSTFYEDVDGDGVKDLIATSSEISTLKTSENTKGVLLYKNTGTNTQPHFEFKSNEFLQHQMIENGTGSLPVFADINNDGLLDLLVANSFNYKNDSSLYSPNSTRINYYENIGSAQNPVFKLVNEDWNNFSTSTFTKRVAPTFGDVDNDGDQDMIVGLGNGKLYYYENTGGAGSMAFNPTGIPLEDENGDVITVASDATPQLFDLDNDGKLDLVIGNGNGVIYYYHNVGTPSAYKFDLENSDLGEISSAQLEIVVPRFVRTNNKVFLFAGNLSGTIAFYDDIKQNIGQNEAFHLVNKEYLKIDTKQLSAPAIAQIRNDNSYDFLVGTKLGGLWSYRPGDTTFLGIQTENKWSTNSPIHVYPNPNTGLINIAFTELNNQSYSYQLINPLGEIIKSKKHVTRPKIQVQLKKPMKGLYIVRIMTSHHRKIIRKIIMQ